MEVAFSMVRHNERNETYVCDPHLDKEVVEQITRRCDKLGTPVTISGSGDDRVEDAAALLSVSTGS